MTILLSEIWPIDGTNQYKIHFGRWDKVEHPLDAWVRNPDEWKGWQEYRPAKNEFNRRFIFSVMQFYHEPDIWLFGGVFEVLRDLGNQYEVTLTPQGQGFIGRLKLKIEHRDRGTRLNFENHYARAEVSEILQEPFSGRPFPGYEDIDLSFDELEALVHRNRADWKAALENVKGIYLITDTQTEKRYVGSAYGEHGIWSRWYDYVASGHGDNVELRVLATDPDLAYCRANFRFALLEHRPFRTADDVILSRESFWKKLLLTRGQQGLNRN